MTAHRRITRVLCQEWGMDMGKRLAHFPTWLPLTAKHWVIFNGRFLFKEEILNKQEAAFELSSLGPGSIVGEKKRKREGNPPPLFPFLPIPYPLPLSTPATQAMRFSANNRLPGSSPLWASEASHAFSSSEAVASPLACLSRYPPNGQLPCRQANNSQMCCAEAAVNI